MARAGNSGTLLPATGFSLGDGGMASPRRGVLAPPLFRFAPGTGARKRGTGEDMVVDFGLSVL